MSESCVVVGTTARARYEGISQAITKGFDCAPSLSEFGTKDDSAVGGYSRTKSEVRDSRGADPSSS